MKCIILATMFIYVSFESNAKNCVELNEFNRTFKFKDHITKGQRAKIVLSRIKEKNGKLYFCDLPRMLLDEKRSLFLERIK